MQTQEIEGRTRVLTWFIRFFEHCDSVLLSSSYVLEGEVPADRVHTLQQHLPALTRGEGLVEFEFGSYRAIRGETPTRPRTDYNPLNRKEYLLHLMRRV